MSDQEPIPPQYENFSNDTPVDEIPPQPVADPAAGYMEVVPPEEKQPSAEPVPVQYAQTVPSLAGAGACATPYEVPCSGATPIAGKETDLISKAAAVDIPAWEARLTNALGQPCQINLQLEAMIQELVDSKARLKAAQLLVAGPQGVLGQGMAVAKQESSFAAVENLVRVIELVCKDNGVRADLAKVIHKIDFVNQSTNAVPESKSFTLIDGGLLYNCVLSAGFAGIFSKTELLAFFEEKFYAQERALVTKFIYYGLPDATKRIQTAIGREVEVNFDIVSMLGSCTTQKDRLGTAKTIVTRTKISQKAVVTAKSTMSSLLSAGKALANKAQDLPPPDKPAKEEDPINSPNVLIPLVEAIEYVCRQHPSVTQAIAAAISTIHFAMIPGPAPVASLELHQAVDTPVVAPSRAGVPPIKDGVLVYTGCFEIGSKGCHSKQHIIDVFEEHFRCREKGFVHNLMATSVPQANQELTRTMGAPVDIEVVWPAIFHEQLKTKERLLVAETLCDHNSQFCILPMVSAIRTVISKFDESIPAMEAQAGPPQNPIKNRIRRIVVSSTPGTEAKPSITLKPLAAGADMSTALIYTCVFERGNRGCLDVTDFKSQLRKLFGIATPKDEAGVHAGLEKADAAVSKLAADATKAFSKLKFW